MSDREEIVANLKSLFSESALYAESEGEFTFQVTVWEWLFDGKGSFDCYCTGCKERSTFWSQRTTNKPPDVSSFSHYVYPYLVTFTCSRNPEHQMYFTVFWRGSSNKRVLEKIGQWPPLAEIAHEEIDRYKKVLTASQLPKPLSA